MDEQNPGDSWIDEELAKIELIRPPGSRVVFVSGNFNIIHPGHLRLLNFAAECGDFLIVLSNELQTISPILRWPC